MIHALGDVTDLLKRFKSAQKHYEEFRSLHQETYDFVAPQRETFRFHAAGQEKNRHVFDSTAVSGLEKFASRIKGSSLPSWKQWFKLEAGSIVPEEQQVAVNTALEEGADVFFNALNHSNFDTEINPALVDLGVGTGAIIIDEGELNSGDLFRFTNVPLSELYPEKPAFGRIRSGWRKHSMAVNKIKVAWPGAELPDKLEKMAERDPDTEVEILNGQLYNHADGLYHNVIIHEGSKSILFSQEFNSQRLIIFRWHVTPSEVYGRGPAMQMLPDIRTLNKMVEFSLQSAALNVGGVFTGINDGIFNPSTVRIAPKTIIPVGSNNNQNPTLRPLEVGGNAQIIQLETAKLQENINKAFFAQPLGEISDPVRSATEIMLRKQEMLENAGASFGRLRSELVEVLVEAGVDILKGLGRFPDISVDGEQVTIKHTSPLAQAEDLEDFQAITQWAQTNIGLVGPEVFAGTAKVEDFPTETAKMLGIPSTLLRTKEETAAIGKQVMELGVQTAGAQDGQPV